MIRLKEVTLKKSSTIKFEGGTIMKKKLNNKKGFSLVELLIVLAILAIIAAISISIFANVLENQRIKADKGTAAYLQSAIQTYMTESDDRELEGLDTSTVDTIIADLKESITFPTTDGDKYGPYLKSDYDGKVKSSKYGGFKVEIDKAAQSVEVRPSTENDVEEMTED